MSHIPVLLDADSLPLLCAPQVTRNACQEMIALAAAGKLTAADISTALDTNTVRLLGRLVQWLQAEPSDQHLLNTERSESLWQLLLLTLANLLKVLQPEEQEAVPDMELVDRFKQQLQSSGGLVRGPWRRRLLVYVRHHGSCLAVPLTSYWPAAGGWLVEGQAAGIDCHGTAALCSTVLTVF